MVQRREKARKAQKDDTPICLLDYMMQSELYTKNPNKVIGDLVIALIAAGDTAIFAIIIALCFLIPSKKWTGRIEEETIKVMKEKGIADVLTMGHKDIKRTDFVNTWCVIKESLRINPPAPITDEYTITRDCKAGFVDFKKGTHIMFYPYGAHRDPTQWTEPEKFMPERFETEHKLYKTPDGQERNELAYIPFSFGGRNCVGAQFAKTVMPSLISKTCVLFNMKYVDPKEKIDMENHKLPIASIFQSYHIPINVNITLKN